MDKLTQKWCLVSFLEPVDEGYEFDAKNWPLHITLADVHDVDWADNSLKDAFEKFATNTVGFSLKSTGTGQLGSGRNKVDVVFLEKSKPILDLHTQLITLLNNHGAVFNNPEYNNGGFLPHITIQAGSRPPKVVERIDNIALIDMFPSSNGHKRKIVTVKSLPKE